MEYINDFNFDGNKLNTKSESEKLLHTDASSAEVFLLLLFLLFLRIIHNFIISHLDLGY